MDIQKKLNTWVPYELTEIYLMNGVLICDSLLKRNETEPFLKGLITVDVKWIIYNKRQAISGRPVTDKLDAISEKVEQDPHSSSYDITEKLRIDHKTVLTHLKTAGLTAVRKGTELTSRWKVESKQQALLCRARRGCARAPYLHATRRLTPRRP
ncbi:Histone-lysine N-methyltransferase SETMAR [Eumeta japonica]|uniref:Histone-lysine N-methyltransferase SETMAR n=1 Tax=Eumeta variegata TaxID=151549 RepID=A0A4C1Z6T1_EUMVA|nr:Histone-lysine N-methyltransferase SETMAR [Eumeta japonica]